MKLWKTVLSEIKSNTQMPINAIVSDIDFSIESFSTYNQLINTYDRDLADQLNNKYNLNQKIAIISVSMLPEQMHWIIWKNFLQISQFLDEIEQEIQTLLRVKQYRIDKLGYPNEKFARDIQAEHAALHQIFKGDFTNFCVKSVQRFIEFMNKLGEQMYLRKTVPFLIFISHCVGVDKWNMMIHYQTYMYKNDQKIGNKIKGFFGVDNKKQKDFFLTICGDGLLISDDHLLLSKVRKMIPFTNQMKVQCKIIENKHLLYQITSGKINSLKINFLKDYARGINFGCGLSRALKYSGYNFLIGLNSDIGLQAHQMGYLDYSVKSSLIVGQNRFYSYSQQRDNCNCKLYSDGCGYYEDLYNQLMRAQKQVCITGWMITPYFLLKRPGNINHQQYRLDGVLCRLAQRGVKIFIICFMQPSLVVNNDSEHVQQHMESMHKNIKVYRHPNVAVPQLWSHHEKMVVIDQKIGFMGGLDICYGRWDTHEHRLVENQSCGYWDGQEFNNYRLKDIYEPRTFWKSNLNKDFQPRMPWHDIAVQIRGDVVIDLLRHFVQYWYFVKQQLSCDPRVFFNLLQRRLAQANQHYEKIQKQYLLAQLGKDTQQTFQMKFNSFKEKIQVAFRGNEQRISEMLIQQRTGMNEGNLKIQMLRSASQWSIGLDPGKYESSIHFAYIDLIENSQSYIYIQNQFFMGLQNRIVECLAERIIKARNQKKPFKVIIVMPLLPGFEGYIADSAASVLRIQMHWQYQAISRGQNSLFQRLYKAGFDCLEVKKWIAFFGLRKGELLNGIPVTQIIYVHSKLMIVDDKRVICGSANINDRSLLGNRDSQIAVCIEDSDKKQTYSFRKTIFQEHFGLHPNDSVDFINQDVWKQLIRRAARNTEIFRNVFGCIPDDLVSKIPDIDNFQQAHGNPSLWFKQFKNIQGHVVNFPLQFMSEEDLTFKPTQKQFFAPDHAFT